MRLITVISGLVASAACLQLDVTNPTSVRQAVTTLAEGLYTYHDNTSSVGQFDQPESWFWWLSGSGWTALMDYTAYTKDTTYVGGIQYAMSQNLGPEFDFAPASQRGWEANDDQAYWVYNALTAMEYNLTATLPTGAPSWVSVAENVFDEFVTRWQNDSSTCAGGLRWQYDPQATGNGWYYKNSVTNGGFFQTAARLARYTGNMTYATWANDVWDWSTRVGLVGPNFNVFDGTSDDQGLNCTQVNHGEWSYNIASYLHGAAHMYNFTAGVSNGSASAAAWETIVKGLLSAANTTFFSPYSNATGIMYEPLCEPKGICNTDQASFKGSLSAWMAKSAVLVPSIQQDVTTLLRSSAQGAASACSGFGNGTCGTKWYTGGYDGQTGFGQELGALDAVLSLMAVDAPALAKASTAS